MPQPSYSHTHTLELALRAFIKEACAFLYQQMLERGAKSFIVGLSGGIDSAVVARLCQIALQECAASSTQSIYDATSAHHINKLASTHMPYVKEPSLLCVFLPSSHSAPSSYTHAQELAHAFKLPFIKSSIASYERDFYAQFPHATSLEVGNFCARMRMALLYHYSSVYQGVVVGTSNASELALGYGTIFGDLAYAFNPIGALFKTEIFALARLLDVPESILNKPPSADLYAGQSDEKDLGFTYARMDAVLMSLEHEKALMREESSKVCTTQASTQERDTTNNATPYAPQISDMDMKDIEGIDMKDLYAMFDESLLMLVSQRIKRNAFKRTMPSIFTPSSYVLKLLALARVNHIRDNVDSMPLSHAP